MINKVGPLEYILDTPSHHRVHHGVNRYCIDKNFGGVFIIWDRIFGMFVHSITIINQFYSQFLYSPVTYYQQSGSAHRVVLTSETWNDLSICILMSLSLKLLNWQYWHCIFTVHSGSCPWGGGGRGAGAPYCKPAPRWPHTRHATPAPYKQWLPPQCH